MAALGYLIRRLATGIPLILGVTFISFLLMVSSPTTSCTVYSPGITFGPLVRENHMIIPST